MTINLINNTYDGIFLASSFIGGNMQEVEKTNYHDSLFDLKNRNMDNEKLICEIKEILCSRFKCDVDMLAKEVGISSEEICNVITGVPGTSPDIIELIKKFVLVEKVEKFYAGDNVAGDKINEIIIKEGDMNKYSSSATDEKMKILKVENADLKVMLQEKDEIIESLRETIKILKKK